MRTEQGTTPFISVAEGSDTPYRLVVEALNLTVDQLEERGDGHPPIKITYGDKTVTLKEGERSHIGESEHAVDVYLRESIAMSPKKAVLQEGQPFYIALMIYGTRKTRADESNGQGYRGWRRYYFSDETAGISPELIDRTLSRTPPGFNAFVGGEIPGIEDAVRVALHALRIFLIRLCTVRPTQ